MKFNSLVVFVFSAVASFFACGQARSPADSIALGHARNCNDAGVWDGLECASPHVPDAEAAPVEKPRLSGKKKPTPVPPPSRNGDCNCDPGDALCDCDEPE